MPQLTVAVVVHDEQGHVEGCVRSVLDQGVDDVEVLLVDDGATGHAPALLDRLEREDVRVRVAALGARAGTAAARAAAVEQARGTHVWFLPPADRLAPAALPAIAESLATTGADLLVLGQAHGDARGRSRPGAGHKTLTRLAKDGPASLTASPGLAATARTAADKVVRKTLLTSPGPPLAPDPALAWRALLTAERIAALPHAVVERPWAPNATERASVPALLDAYDAVLATAGAQAPRVAAAAQAHLLERIAKLPQDQRATSFRRLGEILRPHDQAAGGRVARLRATLVERGDLRAYEALEASLNQARRVRSARAAVTRKARRARADAARRSRDRAYARARRKPLDPDLAVFAAYWNRGYACNPRAIYEAARELVPSMRGVWVVDADRVDSIPSGVEHVVAGTREYFDVIARATTFVNNVNFPNHLVKRPGTVHVMTHHGTPLKRMGFDLRDTQIAGRRMDFAALARRCERWDYCVSSNPLSTLAFERAYPTRYETLETGYPRNDALVRATDADAARIRGGLGIAAGQTAVLYAPTHREYRAGYVPTMDVAAVADALGPDHVLLARLHYFYGADPALRELHRAGRVIDVAAHPSVEELCVAADLLVTDYSSIMFDYAVLDRPIVIHAPDWEVYRAMRGTYFDLMAQAPGLVARTDAEVVAAITSGEAAGPAAERVRAAFRERFCPWDDGHAAERVVRRVWLGEQLAPAAPAPVPVPAR